MTKNVLVLVRHGESEWNKLNLFTGWKDPDLTDKGVAEATRAGQLLKAEGMRFDIAFTSVLTRAQHTLDLILAELGQTGLETIRDQALNERDYGDLSGLNKDDARKRWGEEQVHIWRRSFDVPPPGGESLKDTAARTLPYYDRAIWPQVRGRPQRDRGRARQLTALDDHAARQADAGRDPEGRARDRRADRLSPGHERRCHREARLDRLGCAYHGNLSGGSRWQ